MSKDLKTSKNEKVVTKLKKERSIPYRISIDILGILLILLSGLVGWLPGPGGLPIFLAGLGLLAKNHEWAKRLISYLKDNGSKLFKTMFRDHPLLIILYDILAFILLIIVVRWMIESNNLKWMFLYLILLSFAVMIFLGNNNRLKRLTNKIKNKQNKE